MRVATESRRFSRVGRHVLQPGRQRRGSDSIGHVGLTIVRLADAGSEALSTHCCAAAFMKHNPL